MLCKQASSPCTHNSDSPLKPLLQHRLIVVIHLRHIHGLLRSNLQIRHHLFIESSRLSSLAFSSFLSPYLSTISSYTDIITEKTFPYTIFLAYERVFFSMGYKSFRYLLIRFTACSIIWSSFIEDLCSDLREIQVRIYIVCNRKIRVSHYVLQHLRLKT